MANVRGVEIAHGGDIGKYYNSGMAQPYFIKKIKSLWGWGHMSSKQSGKSWSSADGEASHECYGYV